MKSLGGSLFIRNNYTFDYCAEQSIKSLLEFCDKVSVVDAGSSDGTIEMLMELESKNKNLIVTYLTDQDWQNQQGKGYSKLCYFTDIAISKLDTDYNFYQQADEIIHEDCYDNIRRAIVQGQEGYLISRFNLWQSPYLKLNVLGNRNPCSTQIVRLAKTQYRSYGDAESLAAPFTDAYVEAIRMYHCGFVRKRDVMKAKIINMQRGVFELGSHDVKLDGSDIFIPERWFGPEDLVPIGEPLPALIQKWAADRVYE
jgi:glycosyltransferase involved in cell wall biosynthesis